jgi:aspartyl-tRNA(Asn)/glutamyl-tRNA(Gln) amidotransferase subunit A
MTWTVEDTAYMLQVIAGYDPKDPTTSRAPVPDYALSLTEDMRGMKIGLPRHYFFDPDTSVSSEVVSRVEQAVSVLQELGAQVQEVTLPSLEHVRAANHVIMVTEAYAFHEPNLKSRPQDFGEIVRGRFRVGGMLKASDYLQAQRVRHWCRWDFANALREVDLLVTPTMTQPASAFDGYEPTSSSLGRSFTAPFNVTGLPAISVPCGFTENGLPIGMQIAGRPFDEPGVIQAAYTYQQHAGWFQTRPPEVSP